MAIDVKSINDLLDLLETEREARQKAENEKASHTVDQEKKQELQKLQQNLQRMPQEIWDSIFEYTFSPSEPNQLFTVTPQTWPPKEMCVCKEGRALFIPKFFSNSTFISSSIYSSIEWAYYLEQDCLRQIQREVINDAKVDLQSLPQLYSADSQRNFVRINIVSWSGDIKEGQSLCLTTIKPEKIGLDRVVAEVTILSDKLPLSDDQILPARWLQDANHRLLEKEMDWSIFLIWWDIARSNLTQAVDLFLQLPAHTGTGDKHLLIVGEESH